MLGFRAVVIAIAIISVADARPPQKPGYNPNGPIVDAEHKGGNNSADWDLGIDYNRYLQEVVQVLESDPEFR